MFIHSTCFFNNLTTSLVFTKLHIISYPLNPLLDGTDNVSTWSAINTGALHYL